MKTVKVKKDTLVNTLKDNMVTHVADYELAWEAYHKAVIANATNLLERAKNVKKGRPVQLYINLEMPVNHEDDYVRTIEMCEWEVADEVDLSEAEFRQFVQDEWSWKGQFTASNVQYTGSASPSSQV